MFEGHYKNTIYVKIKQELIVARSVETKREFQAKPYVALDAKPGLVDGKYQVVALGDEALTYREANPKIKVSNGFNHPCVVISDFAVAEATLRYFISKVINRGAVLRPMIILHPLENLHGGISQTEVKMLVEIGIAAGARRAVVWTGRELSDYEVENQQFPLGEGKLLEYEPIKERRNQ